ncbi:hypothetical protein GMLC_36790 [Geomonas limicola]|uniref:Uncharacterized protein n=1 Tax=Geomonas limicola TaxID=2740186 RepID=A0A6V8NCD7_9BACT|nr:hypothetical protein GMLC_36790 [Geomonas limicola]
MSIEAISSPESIAPSLRPVSDGFPAVPMTTPFTAGGLSGYPCWASGAGSFVDSPPETLVVYHAQLERINAMPRSGFRQPGIDSRRKAGIIGALGVNVNHSPRSLNKQPGWGSARKTEGG